MTSAEVAMEFHKNFVIFAGFRKIALQICESNGLPVSYLDKVLKFFRIFPDVWRQVVPARRVFLSVCTV